jgi:flagellar biosynthesis protein FliR
MEAISHIIDLLTTGRVPAAVVAAALVSTRMLAMIRIVPFLGARRAPAPLHVALAIALGLALGPDLGLESVPAAPLVAALAVKEALVGLALGFLASLPFRFAEQAGMIMDQARSTSLSSTSVAGSGGAGTPTGNLLLFGALAVFFLSPAHDAFFSGVAASFEALPVIPAGPAHAAIGDVTRAAVASSAGLFGASVMIALPVLGSVLLTDVAIGAVGRFVPHSGGTFAFMPLRSAVGLGALALSLTVLAPLLADLLLASMRWLAVLQ